jgi:MoxR-like ATPase
MQSAEKSPPTLLRHADIMNARQQVLTLHCVESVEEYIVQLVMATRQPGNYSSDLQAWLEYGASPRGTLSLDRCARAHALLNGKDFVSPDDVQAIAADVLRHRLILSFEAQANGVSTDDVIDELLRLVPVA